MKLLKYSVLAVFGLPLFLSQAWADSLTLSGPDSVDGTYTSTQIAAEATSSNTVNYNGYTGVSLWSFLGGTDPATPTSTNYGSITTSTPAGYNAKNSDLRYYVVATGSSGTTAVSLGQIDPGFTGSGSATPFVAFQSNGAQLTTPVLVVPGGPLGSTVLNLTNLSIQSVAASSGAGGVSTSITTSGNVTSPATYTSSNLPGGTFATAVNVVNSSNTVTDSYTAGIPLATLLQVPSTANPNSQIVVATGTDGYTVVYSYDELLNTDGTANPNDILATATSPLYSDFPAAGLARTIIAGDGPYKHGRWDSNVESLQVLDVTPIPGAWPLFLSGLAAIGLLGWVNRRNNVGRELHD